MIINKVVHEIHVPQFKTYWQFLILTSMSIISSETAQFLAQIYELNKTAPYGYEYFYDSNKSDGIGFRMKDGFTPQIIYQYLHPPQKVEAPVNSTFLGIDFNKTSNIFGTIGLLALSIFVIKRVSK